MENNRARLSVILNHGPQIIIQYYIKYTISQQLSDVIGTIGFVLSSITYTRHQRILYKRIRISIDGFHNAIIDYLQQCMGLNLGACNCRGGYQSTTSS